MGWLLFILCVCIFVLYLCERQLLVRVHILCPVWLLPSLSLFLENWLEHPDFSLDRCSIPSREVSILWSYLDITLLFSSYVYLIFLSFLSLSFPSLFDRWILMVIYLSSLLQIILFGILFLFFIILLTTLPWRLLLNNAGRVNLFLSFLPLIS